MGLATFSLSRMRCFRSLASVQIAPVTLIFGHNNAGKSTLLRAMSLLAASVGSPTSAALDLSCEAARGASYHDLRSRHDALNEMVFTLKWEGEAGPAEAVTLRIMEEADGAHVVKGLSFQSAEYKPFDLQISVDVAGHYEISRNRVVEWSGPITFRGIRPEADPSMPDDVASPALARLGERLDRFKTSLHWLTAVRATVPRRKTIPHRDVQEGADGAWAQIRLAQEVTNSRRELISAVSDTLCAMFDCELNVDLDEGDVLMRGTPRGVSWRVPLADLGEGITQVLPVVTLCCMAERGDLGEEPILCIEQPEMHLHADAERVLAGFLARVAASRSRPRLVLETHSEILLSAFLLEVAREQVGADDVALHWVSRESAATESLVRSIRVDARGRPETWPTGALTERVELARDLFLARRR